MTLGHGCVPPAATSSSSREHAEHSFGLTWLRIPGPAPETWPLLAQRSAAYGGWPSVNGPRPVEPHASGIAGPAHHRPRRGEESAMPDVDEIADGIHRIATFVPEEGLTFNQFLLASDEPLLFHTGPRALFGETLAGIARILDPTRLRWVSWSHFEADECGALNNFLELAPAAEPLHSELGAGLNGSDFAIRPVRTLGDGQVLDLGGHRLQ